MVYSRMRRLAFAIGVLVAGVALQTGAALAASPAPITVVSGGTTTVSGTGGQAGSSASSDPEVAPKKRQHPNPLSLSPLSAGPVLESAGSHPTRPGAKKAKSNPELLTSWEGVNHRDNRLASGGNQFSGEPADQGLCAGNGYVLESVNSALRVFDTNGSPVSPVIALNEFYGFPPAIDRETFEFGPFTFDISCHYDPDSKRWFHLAVDLDQDPLTGAFTGRNYLDLAVSKTSDPTGAWAVYRIPGVNDGSEGTPDHGCTVDDDEGNPIGPGPCFADFPHIGVDKHGVYITTNEFELFGFDFIGAQVYAISKRQLISAPMSLTAYLFNTADDPVREGEPGFTLWPALSAKTFENGGGGAEYFVSSNAVFDDDNADSQELIVWSLSGTSVLSTGKGALKLTKKTVGVDRYTVPPPSNQKFGSIPLGEAFYGATEPGEIDTSDSRVLDVRFANGKVWAVLATGANVGGDERAGVGWYIMRAKTASAGISGVQLLKQGILAVEDESLAYPTIGLTNNGRGVMAFTRVGDDLFPSQGYAAFDDRVGVGDVHMITEGNSPQDGFTEYEGRPRWGDYGAAAVDGQTIYTAGQYIEQGPCTVDELLTTDCNFTRTLFANWSTRVAKFGF